MFRTDTIAAIATSYGRSGVGIIRISGDKAISIGNKIWSNNALNYKTHTMHYGKVVDGDKVLDEALLVIMKGPNSYTGEDVVEIQSHGGPFVLNKILHLIIKYGARIADPGEFTKRAFLNGKMDLTQAEAVMDIIESSSEFARKSSVSQLGGNLGNKVREFRKLILHHTAFIETALDDPEHIDVTGYGEQLKKELEPVINEMSRMVNSWDNGHILKEGIRTAILGKPNAGKSSLMNAILDKERAIVTNVPGTTRDTIEESINLDGIVLNIIDTAGIRQTDDIVEKIGVEKALQEADNADLILYIIDSNDVSKEELFKVEELAKHNKLILIFNKIDLSHNDNIDEQYFDFPVINISAKQRINIDILINKITEMFIKGEIDNNDEIIITNIRHKDAFAAAMQSLNKVIQSIDIGMPEDFYSIDLMAAYEELGLITGETTGEDLVNEIFSKFCVGK